MNNSPTHEFEAGRITRLGLPFGPKYIGPSFAIPLISSRVDANTQYVQRVNLGGKITGFEVFDSVARSKSLAASYEVRIGGDEVYAIVDPDGTPLAGTQRELAPIVNKWVRGIDLPLPRMNFARFCGEHRLAELSAQAAVEEKTGELRDREHAILWFIDTVVLSDLVTTLVRGRGSQIDHLDRDIFQFAISVVLRNKELAIELPANLLGLRTTLSEKQNLELKRLLNFATQATGTRLDLKAEGELPIRSGAPARQLRDSAEALTSRIKDLRRQEVRLATLIEAILTDPPVGLLVLDHYEDRAKFARTAVQHLREILRAFTANENLEHIVSISLSRVIRQSFPRQRARLLLALAQVLGRFPLIAAVIRDVVARSHGFDVGSVRHEIFEHLEGPRS